MHMDDMAQVHLYVDSEKKAEWEGYAKEHAEIGNNSLSALIRMAVNREIHGHHSSATGERTGDVDQLAERQSEMMEKIESLASSVDDMQTQLNEIGRTTETMQNQSALENQLREALPPAKPHSDAWDRAARDAGQLESGPNDEQSVAWQGTLTQIASVAETTEDQARQLLDAMPDVSRERIEGEVRYYRSEAQW